MHWLEKRRPLRNRARQLRDNTNSRHNGSWLGPGRLRPDVASPPPEQISRAANQLHAELFTARQNGVRQCARKQKRTSRIEFRCLEAPVPQCNEMHHERRSRIQYFCIGCWGNASHRTHHCCYVHSIAHSSIVARSIPRPAPLKAAADRGKARSL